MIIDIHSHCTYTRRAAHAGQRFSFEPIEENGHAALDSFISPRKLRHLGWRLVARHCFGLSAGLTAGPEADAALTEFYESHWFAEGPVERIVLLAFDAYHDENGRRMPPPEERGQRGSDMYTSNSLVHGLCQEHPERFLFGASVHPYRENACACIEEVFAHGACLLKWMPLHQNIDIADTRTLAVLRCCARLGLPILVHYGPEFTLTTHHAAYRSALPLLKTLRQLRRQNAMPITIVAHVATPVTLLGERRSHVALLDALLGEFADAPLYADIAAFVNWGKVGYLRKIARRQDLHAKLLFGSDFPIPPGPPRLRRDLGGDYARIKAIPSWIQQAATIYRHLGLNEIVFHRAARLLPNIDHFARPNTRDARPA
jgi:hypothetical protein